jgi:ABC-type polysaccharide/polyol phosphate export permease
MFICLDENLNFFFQATAQISGYIMSNKFKESVSSVCSIIISTISLLHYLTPKKEFVIVAKH